jgi:hypothetical protein
MYPNHVYRPQRVKGKNAAANGKGKTRGAEEPQTDSEGLSFVMPVPAVAQRMGRRAISLPTPPPAYQQTIHIPMVYMPSTPASPSMVPVTIPRTFSTTPPQPRLVIPTERDLFGPYFLCNDYSLAVDWQGCSPMQIPTQLSIMSSAGED